MTQLRQAATPIMTQVEQLLRQAADLVGAEPTLSKVADNLAQVQALTAIATRTLPSENYAAVQNAIDDVDWGRWPGGKVTDEVVKATKNDAKLCVTRPRRFLSSGWCRCLASTPTTWLPPWMPGTTWWRNSACLPGIQARLLGGKATASRPRLWRHRTGRPHHPGPSGP